MSNIVWWIASNNGFSIHFTYNQLIFICKTFTSKYIDWWIRGGVDVMTYFPPQLSKIVTISLNHSKAYMIVIWNRIWPHMARSFMFTFFKGKLLKEGYHFPMISRLIICRVFQLRWITNICCLYLVRIINRSFYYVLYVFTEIRHIILQLNYKDATIKPLKMYRYCVN